MEELRVPADTEWRDVWRRTHPDDQRRVVRAVRAGSAMADPYDAALAVGCARAWRKRVWWGVGLVPVLVGTAAIVAAFDGSSALDGGTIAILAALAGFTALAFVNAARAEQRNRAVVDDAIARGAPPPKPEPSVTDALNKALGREAPGSGAEPG
jgi:hypothetical protein